MEPTWSIIWGIVKNLEQKLERSNIATKNKRIGRLRQSLTAESVEVAQHLKKDIDGIFEREHLKWKQRAEMTWLQKGDRNTKYYHLCTNQRKRRNTITMIIDDDGVIISDSNGIGSAL